MNMKQIKSLFKRRESHSAEVVRLKAECARLYDLAFSAKREAARAAELLTAARIDSDEQRQRVCNLNRNLNRINAKLDAENMRLRNDNAGQEVMLTDSHNQLKFANARIASMEAKLDEYSRAVTMQSYDDNTARACLCQLRVMQMNNARGRTGYGVTAFIPNEVIARLSTDTPERLIQFRDAVFTSLFERAVRGMWHINSRGNISAILFAPVGSKKEGICGAVLDVDTNPHVELARSRANDGTINRIESAIIAAQPENTRQRLDGLDKVLKEANTKSDDAKDSVTLTVSGLSLLPREAKSDL